MTEIHDKRDQIFQKTFCLYGEAKEKNSLTHVW